MSSLLMMCHHWSCDYIELTCTEVMEPFLVVVILSCMVPMSVARVGWYPTADGIRPNRADTYTKGGMRISTSVYVYL